MRIDHAPLLPFPGKRPMSPQPRVRFGAVKDGATEYHKAMALHDAGVALAKAGDGVLATQKLNEAIEAYDPVPLKFRVANVFAEGVEPGLKPNPVRAHEILQDILKTGAIRDDSNPSVLGMGETYLKMAAQDPQYLPYATQLIQKSAEGKSFAGTIGTIVRLVKLNHPDMAKQLIDGMIARIPHFANNLTERMQIARLLAGVYRDPQAKEQPDLSALQDGPKATRELKAIAEAVHASPETRLEILKIFALGQGAIQQDKDYAKSLIDKL